ncbi:MAG: hypothetical protein R3C59_15195 [Planctomycetaceae bacterium]
MSSLRAQVPWIVPTLLMVLWPTASFAQSLTVREMLDRQDEWPKWVRDRTELNINGRYEGRAAQQFRLARLPMLLSPARTAALPRNPNAGQRMTVSGVLVKSGADYSMDVSRIAAGSTDSQRLEAKIEKSNQDQPEQWYQIAEEYGAIAEFYADERLRQQVAELRRKAFQRQHTLFQDDWQKLRQLADFGAGIGIPLPEQQALIFESVVRLSQTENVDRKQLYDVIRKELAGWDQRSTGGNLSAAAEQSFRKNPVAAYQAASADDRLKLHRRFYRTVRLPDVLSELKSDGSNGQDVAGKVAEELPEETQQIAAIQRRYVDYRLTRVPSLTRRQLDELAGLLEESDRTTEILPTVDVWLKAQEKRLNNDQLDGLLATAEEYLFAFERWKRPEHRDAGVELLKRGWQLADQAAPEEAASIAQRLERFGWTRLRDQWMTTEDVARLPRNDVALAMREGRVVAGMKAGQILATMAGPPTRTIRVISARRVQEIWVYGEAGSSAIAIHVERGRSQSPDEAVATLVTTPAQ